MQGHLVYQDPVVRRVSLDLRGAQDPQVGWDFQAEKASRDQLDLQVKTTTFLTNVFCFAADLQLVVQIFFFLLPVYVHKVGK